ncbi:hypothetical protein PRIPAC_95921 [Pristionchus pacificus]|uniref:Uncharacterized protein n=1 Tax=Pristionchus pacificus TaxID=54126 RepID=A0A2A6BY60_PRIPA|nr:hypothetical protein PRIPAC_95921 [Pristionchus pacificus]|eukprot:PDM70703.1 hypothetical protein PRIPAC_43908 [Pristionchus pacificus]
MAYGIGLVFFFFFSFDDNYEKWEVPGAMVLTMVFTGFIVQASALLVIIGHIQRNSRYVYLGCVFPFVECARTSFIVLKSVYEIIFEDRGKVMSEEWWMNTVNSLFFLAVLAWFFSICVVVHIKTAFVIEHNEDQVDEE